MHTIPKFANMRVVGVWYCMQTVNLISSIHKKLHKKLNKLKEASFTPIEIRFWRCLLVINLTVGNNYTQYN